MASFDPIRRHLEARDEILFAYLFGSRAGGRPRPDSDWDVAVFLRPTLSEWERFDLRVQLGLDLEEIGRPDVCVLNDAPPLLAQSALKGRRLVVRDNARWCASSSRPWRSPRGRAAGGCPGGVAAAAGVGGRRRGRRLHPRDR